MQLRTGFSWPDDEEMERVRTARFDTPDFSTQKAIAEKVQMRALETLPCIPLGQLFQPTAFRSDISDIVKAALPMFWGCGEGRGGLALAGR